MTLTPTEAYHMHLFTSKCCHAFYKYVNNTCVCSQCNRIVTQIKDDDVLTISVKFNEYAESNVSADLIQAFKEKAKRFSTDPTYELCAKLCPKCKSKVRYAKNPQDMMIFICSNGKCRYVFDA